MLVRIGKLLAFFIVPGGIDLAIMLCKDSQSAWITPFLFASTGLSAYRVQIIGYSGCVWYIVA